MSRPQGGLCIWFVLHDQWTPLLFPLVKNLDHIYIQWEIIKYITLTWPHHFTKRSLRFCDFSIGFMIFCNSFFLFFWFDFVFILYQYLFLFCYFVGVVFHFLFIAIVNRLDIKLYNNNNKERTKGKIVTPRWHAMWLLSFKHRRNKYTNQYCCLLGHNTMVRLTFILFDNTV